MEEKKLRTVIIFYSKHHRNTRLLVEAIKRRFPEVEIMDVNEIHQFYLSDFDRIGIASGIYFSTFAKPLMKYIKTHLPENKKIFTLYTYSVKNEGYTKGIKKLCRERNCEYIGEYSCSGYNTYGPFKIGGGIKKGHPSISEIQGAVDFYREL